VIATPPPSTPAPTPVATPVPTPPPTPAPPSQCFKKVDVKNVGSVGGDVYFNASTCAPGTVTLFYRASNGGNWFEKRLPLRLGRYSITVDVTEQFAAGIDWYLSTEGATYGSRSKPRKIRIQ
jgi:hypothetical protein